jgi:hypothetical protein
MKETLAMAFTRFHLIDSITEHNGFAKKKFAETVEIII